MTLLFTFPFTDGIKLDARQLFISQDQLLDSSWPTADLPVFLKNITLPFEDLPILRDISYQLTGRPLRFIAVFLVASVTPKSKASLGNHSIERISGMTMRKEHTEMITES